MWSLILTHITMKIFVHETNNEASPLPETASIAEGAVEIDPNEPFDLEEIAISVNLAEKMCIEPEGKCATPTVENSKTENY